MQDDCIAVALGLPQLKILGQKQIEDHFEVTVIYRRREVTCSCCSRVTTKEHDTIVLGDMWAFRRWFLRKHYTLAQYIKEQTDLILSRICIPLEMRAQHKTEGQK